MQTQCKTIAPKCKLINLRFIQSAGGKYIPGKKSVSVYSLNTPAQN